MNADEVVEKVKEILEGIDSDDVVCSCGWWETSTGAEFGARKLKEIIDYLSGVLVPSKKKERELATVLARLEYLKQFLETEEGVFCFPDGEILTGCRIKSRGKEANDESTE